MWIATGSSAAGYPAIVWALFRWTAKEGFYVTARQYGRIPVRADRLNGSLSMSMRLNGT